MLCWRARPWLLSGRQCRLRWSKRWGDQVPALHRRSQLASLLGKSFWGYRARAVSECCPGSRTRLNRCGGGV
jgi:hypothetical protein